MDREAHYAHDAHGQCRRPDGVRSKKAIAIETIGYDEGMKAKPEYVEGREAWTRFQGAMKKVVAVPHSEIQRRVQAHRAETAKNPNRRGPKPKPK
jgi:hypothetical protein